MSTLLMTIIAIAIVDSINPNAVAVQIYLLSTSKPVARSLAFIAGDFLAAWIAGLLIILGLVPLLTQLLSNFPHIILLLQLFLGIVFVFFGIFFPQFEQHSFSTKRLKSLKPLHTFLLGGVIAFAEAPTALPYLGAIERIVQANLPLYQILGILTIYNLVFIFPLVILLLIYLRLQQRSLQLLKSIQSLAHQWFPKIMRLFFVGFGLILIVDSVVSIYLNS
jgi:cytochrome c biogenesis protein CcdA